MRATKGSIDDFSTLLPETTPSSLASPPSSVSVTLGVPKESIARFSYGATQASAPGSVDSPQRLNSSPLPAVTFLIPPPRKTLSAFGLITLGFFWVSGGVYGDEALVLAVPTKHMLFLLVAGALMYALPISLITAELATGWPVKEGMSGWTRIAFGNDWGSQNRWWILTCYLFDSAIYPVIASEYMSRYMSSMGFIHCKLYGTALIVLTTVVKLCGRDWLVRFSSVLVVCSVTPLMLYFAFGARHLNPSIVSRDSGPRNLPLAISYVMWMFSGFFSLGSIAGEVKNPRRSYCIALATLLPLVFCLNSLSLLISVSIDPDRKHFEPGHFEILAEQVLGKWMKHLFFLGAQISLVGVYNSCAITCECALVPYLRPYMMQLKRSSPFIRDSWIGHFLTDSRTTGVARVFIVIVMLIGCAFVWLPYDFLVEFSMLLMALNTVPFLASFVYLRIKQPDKERTFRIPGNTVVAALVALPPFVLTCGYIYIATLKSGDVKVYGVPHLNVVGLAATVVVGIFGLVMEKCQVAVRRRHYAQDASVRSPVVVVSPVRNRPMVDGRPVY